MAAIAPNVPSARHESFASDLAGMFSFLIDPAAAARRLPRKLFWIAPVIFTSICAILYQLGSVPIMQHYLETAPAPANVPPEQYARGMQISLAVMRYSAYAMPIFILAVTAIMAGILLGLSSIAAVKVRFIELFNLIAGCGIISGLQTLAWLMILKAKGEISSQAELKPPLGLDIFLPAGTNKFLLATLGYFSVFQIWWIVMMILVYSTGFRVGKGKAAAVILPLVLFGLLMTLVGAAFQRS